MKLTDEKILELAVASKLARLNGTQHVVAHWPDTIIGFELVTFARAILKEAGVEESERDAERLDWLEDQARISRAGISFDYVLHVDGGYVTDKCYRFMRHHFLGERKTNLRQAIDEAMKTK